MMDFILKAELQALSTRSKKPRNRSTATRITRHPERFVVRAQDGDEDDRQGDIATVTSKPKLKRPPMYKVIFLNDDYTPMEFVVIVLEKFFHMDREKATQIMLTVHTTGSAVVGIFPRDIAETKSELVNEYAQEHQYPLRSVVEMTD